VCANELIARRFGIYFVQNISEGTSHPEKATLRGKKSFVFNGDFGFLRIIFIFIIIIIIIIIIFFFFFFSSSSSSY
jgi:uncharacterized membrane protein